MKEFAGILIAFEISRLIEELESTFIVEEVRRPLPHMIAKGARRLFPHKTLEGWQKRSSKPIRSLPTSQPGSIK